MRQAGTLSNSQDARRLAAYLTSQGMAAVAEQDAAEWTIWVREEDHLAKAKQELAQFVAEPQNARYEGAEKAADELARQEKQRREEAAKNIKNPAASWGVNPGRVVAGPLTRAIIVLSGMVFVLSGFGMSDDKNASVRSLLFLDPNTTVPKEDYERALKSDEPFSFDRLRGPLSPLISIRKGEFWRIFTPIFLHGGPMHLVFNMMWLHTLGGLIEFRRGTGRLALVIFITAIVSNLGQALMPTPWGGNPLFGGFSGVNFGLLGYCWMKSVYEPQLGIRIRKEVVFFMIVMMVLMWVSPIGGMHIANWAHFFGLIAGIVVGLLPVAWRQSGA